MSCHMDAALDSLQRSARYTLAAAIPAGITTYVARSMGARFLGGVAIGTLAPITAIAALGSQYATARFFDEELTEWHAILADVAATVPVYFAAHGLLTHAVGITLGASAPIVGFTVYCILAKKRPKPEQLEMFWRAVRVTAVSSGAVGWGAMGYLQSAVGAAAGGLFERFNTAASRYVLKDSRCVV